MHTVDAAVGHLHRLSADDPIGFRGDAGEPVAGCHRLGDGGLDGGQVGVSPEEGCDRNEVLDLTSLGDHNGLLTECLHQ